MVAGASLAPGAPAKTIIQVCPAARMRAITVTYHDVVESGRFRDGGFEGDADCYKLDGDVNSAPVGRRRRAGQCGAIGPCS